MKRIYICLYNITIVFLDMANVKGLVLPAFEY